MGIEDMGMNMPSQETPKNVEEKNFESDHMSASWLNDDNKAFVKITSKGERYFVSGNIENEEAFGKLSEEELEKKCKSIYGIGPEEGIKNGMIDKGEIQRLKLKWDDSCPVSKICASLEEAQNYAREMLNDRENWFSEKYN